MMRKSSWIGSVSIASPCAGNCKHKYSSSLLVQNNIQVVLDTGLLLIQFRPTAHLDARTHANERTMMSHSNSEKENSEFLMRFKPMTSISIPAGNPKKQYYIL